MKIKIISILIILSISLLALTACGGLLPSIPTPSQTAPGLVYTLAAQTLAVEFTPTAESLEESLPSATSEQPTMTSEATPTLTFTPITPTETPTLTQSPTAIASPILAAGDPKKDLGGPDWRTSFEDGSDWYLFEDDQVRVEVEDGNLKLTALKANNFESWSMSWPRLEDFYLEITTTTGEICGGKDRYGVIVRAPDPNQGYLLGISCDGAYRLREWDGEAFSALIEWTRSEHVLTGPGSTNRLGFWADGERLSVYINGVLMEEVRDSTYDGGAFGAFIAAAETEDFTVEISEAVYWELP